MNRFFKPWHRKLFCFVVLFLGGAAVILHLWVSLSNRLTPVLSIHFAGKVSSGIHRNKFGQFTIVNHGGRPLHWGRADVEAPSDPDLWFSVSSAGLDSNLPHGVLRPGSLTNFPAMVPHTPGARFRVVVSYILPSFARLTGSGHRSPTRCPLLIDFGLDLTFTATSPANGFTLRVMPA